MSNTEKKEKTPQQVAKRKVQHQREVFIILINCIIITYLFLQKKLLKEAKLLERIRKIKDTSDSDDSLSIKEEKSNSIQSLRMFHIICI